MDGIKLRDEITEKVAAEIAGLGSPEVCLATVLVGDDRPSQIYVRNKHRQAEKAGMVSRHVELPPTASQAEVDDAVAALAADPAVHGILVQLPLPAGLDAEAVLDLLPPEKDIDGLTEKSMGRLLRGRPGSCAVHPEGGHAPPGAVRHDGLREARGGRGAFDLGRPADDAAAGPQGRGRHGHAGPLAYAGPGRGVPRGRHPDRGSRHGPHDHRRPRAARARRWSTWGSAGPKRGSWATSTSRPSKPWPAPSRRCRAGRAR